MKAHFGSIDFILSASGWRTVFSSAAWLFVAVQLVLCGCRKENSLTATGDVRYGTASYYANALHGKRTASGSRYNRRRLTAAHRTLPFGTRVRVTNLRNDRSVVVQITDRGPYTEGRIIDVSYAAAKRLDMVKQGTTRVRLTILSVE